MMSFPSKRPACGETQLLVWCARTSLTSEIAERIRNLAAASLDWDYVLSQAQENSIVSLLERNLRAAALELVPREVAAQLKAMARANALRCLALSAELIRVMDSLESRGIAAIPYKGPLIAAQAYGDITARQFEDLDVILRQRDIAAADDIIRGLGYAAKIPWVHSAHGVKRMVPGEYNYVYSEREAILELHTELTLRHFPVPPDLDQFFERAAIVDLGGRGIRTFCAEDALVALCVHGAKDFWERLIWIADIAEMIRSCPALDWDSVQREAEKLQAQRMIRLGLALAGEILGAQVPAEVSARVKTDSQAMNLAAEIAKRHLTRDTHDRTAAERFEFRRRVVPGAIRGWRYAMRLTLSPVEEDWERASLPHGLAPLYVALRPFRLLRKYGWSGK
jgi:hypothetical protein